MAQYSEQLNDIFLALADPTRRAVLEQLGKAPASVGDMAKSFDMTLPSFMKHIHFLEDSGWISTYKHGRVRICTLEIKLFDTVETWLSAQRVIWERRTDRLERLIAETQERSPGNESDN